MRVPTIAAGMLLLLGALLTGGNYIGLVHARRTQVGFSCIPLLGGVLGCVGFLLLPRLRLFAFVPLLVDVGCLPMLLASLVHLLRRKPDEAE